MDRTWEWLKEKQPRRREGTHKTCIAGISTPRSGVDVISLVNIMATSDQASLSNVTICVTGRLKTPLACSVSLPGVT